MSETDIRRVVTGLFPLDRLWWWEFGVGGGSGGPRQFSTADASSNEGLLFVVDSSVAGSAEEGEVVEVGAAFGWGVPGDDVVGLAALEGGVAEHTAPVAYHEREVLGG